MQIIQWVLFIPFSSMSSSGPLRVYVRTKENFVMCPHIKMKGKTSNLIDNYDKFITIQMFCQ